MSFQMARALSLRRGKARGSGIRHKHLASPLSAIPTFRRFALQTFARMVTWKPIRSNLNNAEPAVAATAKKTLP